jgi:phosphoribosylaminoimidazole carboxylase PurE protein
MGSDSDYQVMREAAETLESFGVSFEMTVASAHRSPSKARRYAESAAGRGLKVIIAGAGLAAHLAGYLASATILPVIGVPLAAGPLQGQDALLSTVQMPPGVPVAAMGIGGARNAAILAVEILALSDPALAKALLDYRAGMVEGVARKAESLEAQLAKFQNRLPFDEGAI